MISNEHVPTTKLRQRIQDLAVAGIPLSLIAEVVEMSEETVKKHYGRQLRLAEPEMIERVAATMIRQAEAGCTKSQALYLKTKGAKFGWVEKQVVETVTSEETQALTQRLKELEESHSKDY